ncbi:MAG: IS21 family transposase [Chitinophagaceae bacterium]
MSKIRQILRLFTQGTSKKQISIQTAIARNTVKKYISKFLKLRLTGEDISKMNDQQLDEIFGAPGIVPKSSRYNEFQKLLPSIEKELKRKGVTLAAVWKQYIEAHPDGYRQTSFFEYYRKYVNKGQSVMHINHKAGDKMYIDFSGEKLSITDKQTGEITAVEVFIAVLGCSQLTYVEAVLTQRKEDFIRACENALHYFGGVPAAIVPDNLRTAVTKSSRYEPTINETFADFSEHYDTVVLPTRTYRPRDKALVEGMVKIVYRRIFAVINAEIYFSLDTLNQAIHIHLEAHNNTLLTGREYSRRQQFEEVERAALRPLPVYRYEFKRQVIVSVMKNGHVCLAPDKHYYSVPYQYIGKKVKILFSSDQVEIFYQYQRIAVHKRNHRKYFYTTLNEHLASSHQFLSDWTAERFIEQGKVIHEDVANFITTVIETKQHPEQAYKSCAGILNLGRKVGPVRLTNACRRAQEYGVYNFPIIQQILEKNLDHVNDQKEHYNEMPQHQNIRGKNYYE